MSVLNGEIANYVESDVVKKQIEVNNKILGNVADSTTMTNSDINSSNNSTTATTVIKATSSGGGSAESGSGSAAGVTGSGSTSSTGNETIADSEYEIIGGNTSSKIEIISKNLTSTSNTTASSKYASSLQVEAEAALEPLTSRKGGAGDVHVQGSLLISLLFVAHLCNWFHD